jgi:hypothetical protein
MRTLSDFDRQFGTDEQRRAFLAKMRWPNGVRCPRCKASEKVYALADSQNRLVFTIFGTPRDL